MSASRGLNTSAYLWNMEQRKISCCS